MIPITLNKNSTRDGNLRKLAGAVLGQAISDLRRNTSQKQRKAYAWVFGEDSSIITFETCCTHLDQNPGRVREEITRAFGPVAASY